MTNRLQQLKQLLEEDPNDDFLLFAIAKEYEKIGDTNRAFSYYEQLQIKNPKYLGTYYHLGMLHQEEAQLEKALEIFKLGIQEAMDQKDLHALAELQNAKTNLEIEL